MLPEVMPSDSEEAFNALQCEVFSLQRATAILRSSVSGSDVRKACRLVASSFAAVKELSCMITCTGYRHGLNMRWDCGASSGIAFEA